MFNFPETYKRFLSTSIQTADLSKDARVESDYADLFPTFGTNIASILYALDQLIKAIKSLNESITVIAPASPLEKIYDSIFYFTAAMAIVSAIRTFINSSIKWKALHAEKAKVVINVQENAEKIDNIDTILNHLKFTRQKLEEAKNELQLFTQDINNLQKLNLKMRIAELESTERFLEKRLRREMLTKEQRIAAIDQDIHNHKAKLLFNGMLLGKATLALVSVAMGLISTGVGITLIAAAQCSVSFCVWQTYKQKLRMAKSRLEDFEANKDSYKTNEISQKTRNIVDETKKQEITQEINKNYQIKLEVLKKHVKRREEKCEAYKRITQKSFAIFALSLGISVALFYVAVPTVIAIVSVVSITLLAWGTYSLGKEVVSYYQNNLDRKEDIKLTAQNLGIKPANIKNQNETAKPTFDIHSLAPAPDYSYQVSQPS